jgi:integrase
MTKRPKRAPRKMRITELTVRRAKPQARAFLTWDTRAPNLALRTQPTGFKSWAVIYSRNGRSRWLTLGNASTIPLETARIMAQKAMVMVAEGGDPAADRKAERGAGTFAELAAKYVEQHAKRHNKSWAQADALVRRFAIPKWGKLAASSITRGDVKAMMAKIEAPILANQALAAVSAVFSWGVKEEIVAANPCKLITRNPTQDRERILSASEIPLVWKALDAIEPVIAAALKAILLLGQRPGEIRHMRREHIVDGWWTMPGALIPEVWPGTKNGDGHRVWLSEPVRELLAGRLDGGPGYVFATRRGGPLRDLDDGMRVVCGKLGIEKVTPHDLRRTFGSMVTALRFGRQAMDRILNHADRSTGSIYDRFSYSVEDQHIMETVAAHIMALVEGREDKAANVVPPRA